MNSALLSSKKMDWCTPQDFFDRLNEEFGFVLDAAATDKTAKCPLYYTPETDGLSQSWDRGGAVFCNPPYGREIGKWPHRRAFGDGYFFRRSVNFVDTSVKRGDIYYADLSPVVGSEQGGVRPVLIIQNDTGNRYSPTVIAAAITSQTGKAKLPTHIDLPVDHSCGLSRDSVVLLEQVRTLDKKRLREKMGHVEENVMEKVDLAIAVSFGLPHDQMV